jgi:uncharacterized membrane protein YeaQ/YmgE (transglycosylase-associated protein family)
MSIAAWIIMGLIAGWIVDNSAERNHDLPTSLVIGVAGPTARKLCGAAAATLACNSSKLCD